MVKNRNIQNTKETSKAIKGRNTPAQQAARDTL